MQNIKIEETKSRATFRLYEPILLTTAEKIYGEIDHKIDADNALNSPIKVIPKKIAKLTFLEALFLLICFTFLFFV